MNEEFLECGCTLCLQGAHHISMVHTPSSPVREKERERKRERKRKREVERVRKERERESESDKEKEGGR
jgi:hypothetical protein